MNTLSSIKQIAYKEVSKIPMVQHLFWKAKDKFQAKIRVVTMREATDLTLKWLTKLPNDYDCIIGVPRSGLWVAGTIALKLGLPLSTPTSFLRGESWYTLHLPLREMRRVLLVEDDVIYGKQILKYKHDLESLFPDLQVETASLFATTNGSKLVDYCFQVRNPPLIYEWTLLTNMAGIGKLAVDMDGVLCEECPILFPSQKYESLYSNGDYPKWIANAKPYLIPKFKLEAVVTSRLEKYRKETEDWLNKNGVQYEKLIMLNLNGEKERTLDSIIRHKVDAIKKLGLFWYWESNVLEAQAIFSKTRIPVLCTGTMELLL